jgi:hypothetical protein
MARNRRGIAGVSSHVDFAHTILGSFAAHVGGLVILSSAPPAPVTRLQEELVLQRQVHAPFTWHSDEPDSEHEAGASRCCDEVMGSFDGPHADRRLGVAGPADNPDPRLARNLEVGSNDEPSPRTPWGRDEALGTDPISGHGHMYAEEIGIASGEAGLGADAPEEEGMAAEESRYGYRCRLP